MRNSELIRESFSRSKSGSFLNIPPVRRMRRDNSFRSTIRENSLNKIKKNRESLRRLRCNRIMNLLNFEDKSSIKIVLPNKSIIHKKLGFLGSQKKGKVKRVKRDDRKFLTKVLDFEKGRKIRKGLSCLTKFSKKTLVKTSFQIMKEANRDEITREFFFRIFKLNLFREIIGSACLLDDLFSFKDGLMSLKQVHDNQVNYPFQLMKLNLNRKRKTLWVIKEEPIAKTVHFYSLLDKFVRKTFFKRLITNVGGMIRKKKIEELRFKALMKIRIYARRRKVIRKIEKYPLRLGFQVMKKNWIMEYYDDGLYDLVFTVHRVYLRDAFYNIKHWKTQTKPLMSASFSYQAQRNQRKTQLSRGSFNFSDNSKPQRNSNQKLQQKIQYLERLLHSNKGQQLQP